LLVLGSPVEAHASIGGGTARPTPLIDDRTLDRKTWRRSAPSSVVLDGGHLPHRLAMSSIARICRYAITLTQDRRDRGAMESPAGLHKAALIGITHAGLRDFPLPGRKADVNSEP